MSYSLEKLIKDTRLNEQEYTLDLIPEQHLASAVVARACLDVIRINGERPSKESRESREFINSNNDNPLSFNWWCWAINLDPDHLRKKIKLFLKA